MVRISRVSPAVRSILEVLARQHSAIGTEMASIDKGIMALHRGCEASRRLAEIPGIGPVGATALVAEIGDWRTFSSGRSLAAWIGLVPKQHTSSRHPKRSATGNKAASVDGFFLQAPRRG